MEDPVSTIDGNSYERAAIERWFATRRITSPLTGARLGTTVLSPNLTLRRAIVEFIDTKLPQLKELERAKPNLEKAIELREEDLRQLKQEMVPRREYDRILRLLEQSKKELEQTKKDYREQSVLLDEVRNCSARMNTLLQGAAGTGMPYEGSRGSGGGGRGAAEEPPKPPPPAARPAASEAGAEAGASLNSIVKCVATLQGHTDYVNALAMSQGKLYSGSDDNTIRIWDAESGNHLRTLQGHTDWVRSLAMSQGKLYSGSDDKTIRVWSS